MKTKLDAGDFGFDFVCTADWRREKAAEHPDDHRNIKAAELLDRLAQDAANAPDSVASAYRLLWERVDASEVQSELLREVGFSWWPETAAEFVERLAEVCNPPTASRAA